MAIFNSYVKLPEGKFDECWWYVMAILHFQTDIFS